jgi:hypothetical protein
MFEYMPGYGSEPIRCPPFGSVLGPSPLRTFYPAYPRRNRIREAIVLSQRSDSHVSVQNN